MYDKIGRLSMKSLIATNSSKLITLISSDIFSVERGLTTAPTVLAAPFINIVCYIFLGFTAGWWYSLGTFLFWIIIFVL